MTHLATPTAPTTPVEQVISKLVEAFNAYGLSVDVKSSEQLAAAQAFEGALDLTRKLFANAYVPTVLVPQGYWLAPERVTSEMTEAALEVADLYRMGRPELPGQIFQAMRREAPLPPAITLTVSGSGQPVAESVQEKRDSKACAPWQIQPR